MALNSNFPNRRDPSAPNNSRGRSGQDKNHMLLNRKFYSITKYTLFVCSLIIVAEFSFPQFVNAQAQAEISAKTGPIFVSLNDNSYEIVQAEVDNYKNKTPKMVRWVTVTAYSSTVDQCDDTPFISANGSWVYDGMVAANSLPFGTKVKLPDHFGDKVFTVEDRMNKKYNSRVDVWMPTREQAKQFGVRYLKLEVYN